jgi:hypothetical protein
MWKKHSSTGPVTLGSSHGLLGFYSMYGVITWKTMT